MGFFSALTLVLITLKLLGYIAISWWLVFAPIAAGVSTSVVAIVALVVIKFFQAEIPPKRRSPW